MIQCTACGDSCGWQAVYIGSAPYCVSCQPYRPTDFLADKYQTGHELKRLREWAGADVQACAARLGITAEQLVSFESGFADNQTYRVVKEAWQRLLC